MKRFFRIFIRVIIVFIFLLGSLLSFIVYKWETSIDKVLSKEQQNYLYTEIDTTKKLPENFYRTINKYFPEYLNSSVFINLFNKFRTDRYNRNPYSDAYIPFVPGKPLKENHWIPFGQKRLVIAFELEEKFSAEKCYAHYLKRTYYGHNIKGVKVAAWMLYKKKLTELTEREIIALHLIPNKPSFYNNPNNTEPLSRAIDDVIVKHNKRSKK